MKFISLLLRSCLLYHVVTLNEITYVTALCDCEFECLVVGLVLLPNNRIGSPYGFPALSVIRWGNANCKP